MLCTASQVAVSATAAERPRATPLPLRFPNVIWQKNRGYVLRSELDKYKSELAALALGVPPPPAPPPPMPDPFVPLKQVAAELGVGRRTIGRRIVESRSGEAA